MHGVHVEAKDVKATFEKRGELDNYNNYFKFSFVRNPFDWLVSTYLYIKNSKGHNYSQQANGMNFNQWLDFQINTLMKLDRPFGSNKYLFLHQFIRDEKDNLIVDFVGKTENIDLDMKQVFDRIKNNHLIIPKVNVNIQRNADYRQYYNTESKNLVMKVFGRDLDEFKYVF